MILPSPNSEFLADVVESLRRRSKALKNKWFRPVIDRVLVREGAEDIEMLEIRIELAAMEGTLNFTAHIFEDRWIHLFGRKMVGQTVHWKWQKEGRLLKPSLVRSMTESLEETSDELSMLSDLQSIQSDDVNELDNKWSQLISSSLSKAKSPHETGWGQ